MSKVALIRFLGRSGLSSSAYSYFTDLDLEDGDTVVCDTSNGLSLGQFVGYTTDKTKTNLASKWLVDKVDLDAHQRRQRALELKELTDVQNSNRLSAIQELESFKVLI